MPQQLSFDFDPDAARPRESVTPPVHDRRASARTKPAPFHYTNALWDVVRDIVHTLEEFRHVDLKRVLLSAAQARQDSHHGVYASCMPLRFQDGATDAVYRRRLYRMPPLIHEGREILYILYFMLPRFHDEQDYHGKLATIIHELYHISPHFNGDIRRFPGKNFAHGRSREAYHRAMERLADEYLARSPNGHHHEFLKRPFAELAAPGGIVAVRVPKPRPVLVQKGKSSTGKKR